MMVSSAMAVLPVLRSPMMSSRCPRPMGVIASIALMPVWSGSCTGLRETMPGAWISSRRFSLVATGPLPSIGRPRGFTTRPMSALPTGTERMPPVSRTAWPSSTVSALPSTTAPIDSSSRFSARPRAPRSNSSSSLTAVSGRPATRATPSPTSSTRPTWALTVVGLNDATCRRSASAISSALMVSSGMGDIPRSHLTLELVEAVAHRSVDHDVADTRDEAAHHAGIDDDLDLDLFAGRAAQRRRQPGHLLLVQLDRGADLGDLASPFGRGELDEPVDDFRDIRGASRRHQQQHQRGARGQDLAGHQVF